MLLVRVPLIQLLDSTSVCRGKLNNASGSDPSRLIFESTRLTNFFDTLLLNKESRVADSCILFDKSIPTRSGRERIVLGIDPSKLLSCKYINLMNKHFKS
jgi:hypothetical protein